MRWRCAEYAVRSTRMITFRGLIDGIPRNWIQWLDLLDFEMRESDVPRRNLESFFPYLEAGAFSLITDISEHKLRRVQILSNLGGKIGNADFL